MCSMRGIQPYHVGRLPDLLMTNVLYPRLLDAERLISLAAEPDGRMLMAMILDDHRTKSWEHAVEFYRAALARPEFEELAEEMKQRGTDVAFTP